MNTEQALDLKALKAAARAMEPLAFRDSSDSDGEWEAEFVAEGRAQAIGRAEAAIKAYLAACRDEQAEVVAWQWQQCKSLQPGVWPEQWNNIELRPGEDRTQYWRDLAARIPDEVRVRPLYASPPAVAAGGVTAVEAAQMARTRLINFANEANAGRAQAGGRELARKVWGAFAEFDRLTAALAVRDEGIREGDDGH